MASGKGLRNSYRHGTRQPPPFLPPRVPQKEDNVSSFRIALESQQPQMVTNKTCVKRANTFTQHETICVKKRRLLVKDTISLDDTLQDVTQQKRLLMALEDRKELQYPKFTTKSVAPKPLVLSHGQEKSLTEQTNIAASSSFQSEKEEVRIPRKWTLGEQTLLIRARDRGQEWDDICAQLPGRSSRDLRKRYQSHKAAQHAERLAAAYMNSREEMWNIVAARFGETFWKWDQIEKMCMRDGLDELTRVAENYQQKQKEKKEKEEAKKFVVD